MNAERSLEGKVVLITGASRGIGAAIAESLALEGATVIGTYLNKMIRAQEVEQRILGLGGKVRFVQLDVTAPDSTAGLVTNIESVEGKVDVLFNNVAGGLEKDKGDDYPMLINAEGPATLTELVSKLMPDGEECLVVGIPSVGSEWYGMIEQISNYGVVAQSKKRGQVLVDQVIERVNQDRTKPIKSIKICGQLVEGTFTGNRFIRKLPDEISKIRETAEGGKFPQIEDMAQAAVEVVTKEVKAGYVKYVGIPNFERDEVKRKLSMYSDETRLVDWIVFPNFEQSFAYLKVKEEHTKEVFEEGEMVVEIEGRGTGEITVRAELEVGDEPGHFGVIPGHKAVAALKGLLAAEYQGKHDDEDKLFIRGIEEAEFKNLILPKDRLSLRFEHKDFDSLSLAMANEEPLSFDDGVVDLGEREMVVVEEMDCMLLEDQQPFLTETRLFEAFAQASLLSLMRRNKADEVLALFGSLRNFKYTRPVLEGEVLEMEVRLEAGEEKELKAKVVGRVRDEKIGEGIVGGVVIPKRVLPRLIEMARRDR